MSGIKRSELKLLTAILIVAPNRKSSSLLKTYRHRREQLGIKYRKTIDILRRIRNDNVRLREKDAETEEVRRSSASSTKLSEFEVENMRLKTSSEALETTLKESQINEKVNVRAHFR